jgi:hypothetical protein
MESTIQILEEPRLAFRHGQALHDPRDGLSVFGPFDADDSSHLKSISYAAVGTPAGLALFEHWAEAMTKPSTAAPKDKHRLWPIYPGFEAAFHSTLHRSAAWTETLDAAMLQTALQLADPHRRAHDAVEPYLRAIETAHTLDESVAAVVCIVPEELHTRCRPQSIVPNATGERVSKAEQRLRAKGNLDLFSSFDPQDYQMSVDFRRQLKARSMRFGLPVQILRESTLRLHDDATAGARGLTPLSNRMWNIGTAVYYKAGGKPWKLAAARDGVCYVGLAFRRTDDARQQNTACCAAQMFLNSGDGIVFRGSLGPWYSPERKQCHLTKSAARDLLQGTLATYAKFDGKPLQEVFLHSRSDVSPEEFSGYQQACPPGTKLVAVRVRLERQGLRLFREGSMPVLRGTFVTLSRRSGFLFAAGFKPRLATYDGWETPAPLRIDIQHGDAEIDEVARDILGLTKLNYNACTLGNSQPVTVGFSDAVGEILVANPTVRDPRPQFKFYI